MCETINDSDLLKGFVRKVPVLSFAGGSQKVQLLNYWAQIVPGGPPVPVSLRFMNGSPESVTFLGEQGIYSTTMVYSWGPLVVYCDPAQSIIAYEDQGGTTLGMARERMLLGKHLLNNFCPCCHQRVKLYRRRLHSEMALFLIKLVKAYQAEQRGYSTRELLPATSKSSTDGAFLTRWDLVEGEPSMNSSGAKKGIYRPTRKGIEFAQGRISVPSHVHILCGKTVGFSEAPIYISQCLGRRFNYAELMHG